MRKLLLLFTLLPLLFLSCSSDDDDTTTTGIVGTWVTESAFPKSVLTNNEELLKAVNEAITSDSFFNETLTFTADGKLTVKDDDGSETGKYTLNGNMLTISFIGETVTHPISLSANSFTLNVDETEEYKEMIDFFIPDATAKGLEIYKVVTSYSYKRK